MSKDVDVGYNQEMAVHINKVTGNKDHVEKLGKREDGINSNIKQK
jgi:hypothetical protein